VPQSPTSARRSLDDPAQMSAQARLVEVADILADGLLRLRARAAGPPEGAPESARKPLDSGRGASPHVSAANAGSQPLREVADVWHVYICGRNGHLYTSITTDVPRRMRQHGAELLYSEEHPDKHSAARREEEIKGWRREKKPSLIRRELSLPGAKRRESSSGCHSRALRAHYALPRVRGRQSGQWNLRGPDV